MVMVMVTICLEESSPSSSLMVNCSEVFVVLLVCGAIDSCRISVLTSVEIDVYFHQIN